MLSWPSPDPLLEELIPMGLAALPLLEALEKQSDDEATIERLMTAAHLPQTRRHDALRILHILHEYGYVSTSGPVWRRLQKSEPSLRWRLLGAMQAKAEWEKVKTELVLTQGSHAEALREAITRYANCSPILRTDELFREMAARTPEGGILYFIMPFFDETGLLLLLQLTEHLRFGARIHFITRSHTDDNERALRRLTAEGNQKLAVRLYQRATEGGYETFHAKLVANPEAAYVGSANLTRPSLEISAELGIYLKGRPAQSVHRLASALWVVADEMI